MPSGNINCDWRAIRRSAHPVFLCSACRISVGGEDGVVKLLDVFYKGQRTGPGGQIASDFRSVPRRPAAGGDSTTHDRTEPDLHESSDRFHYPYARVAQTLPSHESSVGALAVGFRAENSCIGRGAQSVVISGGGKMELRAWCVEDQLGVGANVGRRRVAAVGATSAPPVSLRSFAASLAQLSVFFVRRNLGPQFSNCCGNLFRRCRRFV